MAIDTSTTVDNQPTEEAVEAGGMDAIKEAIKASLDPAQIQESQPEETTETQEQPVSEEIQEDHSQSDEQQNSSDSGWQKRIDRLTAQKKDLEEQLHELRQTKYEAKSTPEEKNSISELIAKASTHDDLDRLEQDAMDAEKWAKRTLGRYRRDPESVEKEIERKLGTMPDDVEEWLENLGLDAEFSRESDIPKRRKAIQLRAQSSEFAAQKYPWLRDPTNPARAAVDDLQRKYPAIKDLEDADLWSARALVGFYIEQEQQNKTKAPAKTPEPTRQPGKPAVTQNTVSESEQRVSKAKELTMKTGSRDGLKDFIKAAMLKGN
jgi:hypothetical protein